MHLLLLFLIEGWEADQRRSQALTIRSKAPMMNRATVKQRGRRLQVHRRGVRLFHYTTIKGLRRATIRWVCGKYLKIASSSSAASHAKRWLQISVATAAGRRSSFQRLLTIMENSQTWS